MSAASRPQPRKRPPPANRAKSVPHRPVPSPAPSAPPDVRTRTAPLDWISFAFICAIAVLSALFELMLIPLYIGSVIIPVSVVAAIIGNIALPWWGHRTIGRSLGAVAPVLLWLVVLLGLSVVTRPEGDLFVTAAYNQSWVYYGVILLGAVAGFTTVLRSTSPKPSVEGRRETAQRRISP